MYQIEKPMLAGKCGPIGGLSFPVLATPKLDGIRCLIINGRAVTRTFKPIPNNFTRQWLESHCPDGLDGELIVEGLPFGEVSGSFARESGEPDFTYCVFDYVSDGRSEPYISRMIKLAELQLPGRIRKVCPEHIADAKALTAFEEKCLSEGYEGVMIRSPFSPYKCGRSTTGEGYLLKIKRFEDSEAVVVACLEEMANDNIAERDAFGRTKRSSHQAGKRGKGTLGALLVRWNNGSDYEFSIGSGFDSRTRDLIWSQREATIGRVVKFKHQPNGAKDAPRFPIFLGFRERWDMGRAA